MGLASLLPSRPLRFAETMRRTAIPGIDIAMPLWTFLEQLTDDDEALVIACLLMTGDGAEHAAFNREEWAWNTVAVIPNITRTDGVDASLDVLESWLFDHYPVEKLVAISAKP